MDRPDRKPSAACAHEWGVGGIGRYCTLCGKVEDKTPSASQHVCRPEQTDERTATCPVCLAVYVLDEDSTADERSYADAC